MAPPVKVLYVITTAGVGGAERVLEQLLARLDRKAVSPVGVAVLKNGGPMEERWRRIGVPVFPLGMRRLPLGEPVAALRRVIAKSAPEVVHAFLYKSGMAARFALWGNPLPLLVAPRINLRTAPAPVFWADRIFRRENETCVCESRATAETMRRRGAWPGESIVVIPNAVDADQFAPRGEERKRLRSQWGARENQLVLGATGRLHPSKGHDVLIRAFETLSLSHPRSLLVLAGEGPARASLERMAAGLKGRVIFLGRRDDVPAVLSGFDLYVLPSRQEGMPNALLEAMAAGLPAVASDVDGVAEILPEGPHPTRVPPDDPRALAEALAQWMADPDGRRREGEGNRERARGRPIETMVREYEALYERRRSSCA
jgi:glycosyltransferase involved in cell wall biosynthesis